MAVKTFITLQKISTSIKDLLSGSSSRQFLTTLEFHITLANVSGFSKVITAYNKGIKACKDTEQSLNISTVTKDNFSISIKM